jgi:hypothetical protein
LALALGKPHFLLGVIYIKFMGIQKSLRGAILGGTGAILIQQKYFTGGHDAIFLSAL